MQVRHCVEEANVNETLMVIDPKKIRHVIIAGGKIESMSGFIDPASHLNFDFVDHKVTNCVIAEKFEKGAPVKLKDHRMVFATLNKKQFAHYGFVDYTERLENMIQKVKKNIDEKKQTGDFCK